MIALISICEFIKLLLDSIESYIDNIEYYLVVSKYTLPYQIELARHKLVIIIILFYSYFNVS